MRGATSCCRFTKIGKRHFNPRTPCGVRLCKRDARSLGFQFQSTHPLRGATILREQGHAHDRISIHAPLAGCDWNPPVDSAFIRHFNPRTPCGVRLQRRLQTRSSFSFQSTHPLRGATAKLPKYHGKFAKKLQNFCKAKQRAALPRVGQRESGRYFRPCAVRTSQQDSERFRFASDNERALRSVARLCAEVLDAGFILVSKVIKA